MNHHVKRYLDYAIQDEHYQQHKIELLNSKVIFNCDKYRLVIDERKTHTENEKVFRLISNTSFNNRGFQINKDDIGGLIDKSSRLDSIGTCWVDYKSTVLNNSVISNSGLILNGYVCNNCTVGNDSLVVDSKIFDSHILNRSTVINESVIVNSGIANDAFIDNSKLIKCITNGRVEILTNGIQLENYYIGDRAFITSPGDIINYSGFGNNAILSIYTCSVNSPIGFSIYGKHFIDIYSLLNYLKDNNEDEEVIEEIKIISSLCEAKLLKREFTINDNLIINFKERVDDFHEGDL